jgi:hypothetical protein
MQKTHDSSWDVAAEQGDVYVTGLGGVAYAPQYHSFLERWYELQSGRFTAVSCDTAAPQKIF